MLRLDITGGARWIDCGLGVRIECLPVTTELMAAARRDPRLRELAPEDMAEPDRETAEALGIALARAVARRCIVGWEGVGDAEGRPVAPSPEGIDALMSVPGVFEAFQARVMGPAMLIVAEKNASAPSPSGTTAGATATARPARARARTARRG